MPKHSNQPDKHSRFLYSRPLEEATDKLIAQQEEFTKTLTAITETPQFEISEMRNTSSKIAKLLKGE